MSHTLGVPLEQMLSTCQPVFFKSHLQELCGRGISVWGRGGGGGGVLVCSFACMFFSAGIFPWKMGEECQKH